MISIRIENVNKSYKQPGNVVNVLKDINLEIKPGDFYFLLGPSGCGKTTLLRIISGLIEASSGKILFGNKDITNEPPQKRNCPMVFQNYALWPHMSVQKNVEFGMQMKGISSAERKNEALEKLEMVQMAHLANRKPTQLSGGQQQRVALARALASRPEILLLDEPLSNLDAKLRLTMREEIHRIVKDNNITAVYVTHDQQEALSMADTIAVMNSGKVVQTGSPEKIYRRPANSFVAEFIGECNFIKGKVDKDNCRNVHAVIGDIEMPFDCEGSVKFGIRPEDLDVQGPTKGRQTGTVLNRIYQGENALLEIDVCGTVLKAKTASKCPFNSGDNVSLSVEPEDIIFLDKP